MEFLTIPAQPRLKTGKTASKAVRNNGMVPSIVYGGNQQVACQVKMLDLRHALYTLELKLIELDIDGEKIKCVIKDYQLDPVKDTVTHVDFLRLVDGHPIKLEVPIRFEGAPKGVKIGGKFQQLVRKVKIKTMPEHIVGALITDVTELEIGDSVRVRDLEVPANVEVMNNDSIPIARIEIPRSMRSAATAAEKEDTVDGGEEAVEGAATEGAEGAEA